MQGFTARMPLPTATSAGVLFNSVVYTLEAERKVCQEVSMNTLSNGLKTPIQSYYLSISRSLSQLLQ